jgi:flagellar biosynthesis/type III secretory pathway protein FliH
MSWSNVIKPGENVTPYCIRPFDPDSLDPPPARTAPTPPKPGAVRLPGGSTPVSRAQNSPPGEDPEKESPEEKLARLEREAYEKGFDQGRKDGLALEQKQIQEQRQQVEALFSELRGLKSSLFREAEQDCVTLSSLIARRILRAEIRTDPAVIQRTVREAFDFVADRSRLRISIHPEDMEEMHRILPELAAMTEEEAFQVVEDETLERGGCLLETGFGTINATVSDQCVVIEKALDEAFHSRNREEA